MQIGDFVVAPSKADRTLNFGRVTGDFYVEKASADLHPNRRPVQWVRTGVPRAEFSASPDRSRGSVS
jgi:restriction system protein